MGSRAARVAAARRREAASSGSLDAHFAILATIAPASPPADDGCNPFRGRMETPSTDARALATAGLDALRRGDARAARESFEKIVRQGHADAGSLLALAHACSRLGDAPAAIAALDKLLAQDPRNIRALILKADQLAAQGDDRAASSHYQFAVQVAQPAEQLPPDVVREVERAKAMGGRYAQKFEQFLFDRIGAEDDGASPRFRQSLDIMVGRKNIYFQQPQAYYFPELPQVQFYDRSVFPWMDGVEAATAGIRAEASAALAEGSGFRPYVEGDPRRPRKEQSGMTDNPDWSAFYLWKNGEVVPDNAARCPRTMAALAGVPLAQVSNRSPSVLFSLLRPGARIPPHSGLVNTRLICHLPLIVPPGCGFRVGNDSRAPLEGKAWAFDDTIEHEAWNGSREPRVILLFEVWRPELSEKERALVRAMFDAIDAYSGQKPSWSI
jgi:aspartyl/asparaginyl beta-hydroxylase (cupin superfamily)